ncbi:putative mitogen-activated protein kinase kinase kinase 7-like isoform X2 [Drosophila innubila]|nr:putative mitogen-activated protein kinase kinase kinase 7-like isoform X2 [Drosophila innubila]
MVKRIASNCDVKDFQNEIKYLSLIKHDNFMKLYGSLQNVKTKFLLVMDYADCGSLYDFLYDIKNKDRYISYSCKLSWMHQCAKGLDYLHSLTPKIFHNDLRTRHLLLCNNLQTLKICDLSKATESDLSGTNKSYILNIFAEKSDVYSFGIVLWETFIAKNNNHKDLDMENAEVIDALIRLCCDCNPICRFKMRVFINILSKVNWNELQLTEQPIGWGSFGDVYKAVWKTKNGDRNIAIKRIRVPEQEICDKGEVKCLLLANHDNIVKLFGFTKSADNRTIIAMEYAECGSIYNFLHDKGIENQEIQVSIYGKLNWMLQCAKGVAYLHGLDPKILHRDLKSSNLLLFNKYLTLKICDFGTARTLATVMSSQIGTAGYMAPEVYKDESYTEKCDVYSFGIICWEIMSQKKPFYHVENRNFIAILRLSSEKNGRPPIDDVKIDMNTKNMKALIQKCWDVDAKKRPTMKELVKRLSSDMNYKPNEDIIRPLPTISEKDFADIPLHQLEFKY